MTDTQGYSVYGWVKFFVPDFNKLPYSLPLQGDKPVPGLNMPQIIDWGKPGAKKVGKNCLGYSCLPFVEVGNPVQRVRKMKHLIL